MEELGKALEVSLQGLEAERAITAFHSQIESWGVALPFVQPLVLDFGLGDFSHTGLVECWIANEIEAGYCGKYLFVFDGQTCPAHSHRAKHESFFVVKGRVSMTVDGVPREINEGELAALPPGKVHSFTGLGPALLLELSTPCLIDDNYFENTAIPIGGNHE